MCFNRRIELSRPIGLWQWRRVLRCSSCGNTAQHRKSIDRGFYHLCNGRNDIFIWWFSGEKTIFFPGVDGVLTIFDNTPRRLQDWIKRTSLTKLQTRSEGIQNLKYFVDWLWFLHFNKNLWRFWLMMGYEAHLNISQKVFVVVFYTTVVNWTYINKKSFRLCKLVFT
jgi:hypothetical protein